MLAGGIATRPLSGDLATLLPRSIRALQAVHSTVVLFSALRDVEAAAAYVTVVAPTAVVEDVWDALVAVALNHADTTFLTSVCNTVRYGRRHWADCLRMVPPCCDSRELLQALIATVATVAAVVTVIVPSLFGCRSVLTS